MGCTLMPPSKSPWLRATAKTQLPAIMGIIAKPALVPVFHPRVLAASKNKRLTRRNLSTRPGSRCRMARAAGGGAARGGGRGGGGGPRGGGKADRVDEPARHAF